MSTFVLAAVPKVWSSADTLRASDLNANFAYVLARAGHTGTGAITNADIAASAAIATSKLAAGTLIPKAWGFNASCTSSAAANTTCGTVTGNGLVFYASSGAAGTIRVWTTALPTDATFGVQVSTMTAGAICHTEAHAIGTLYPTLTTPQFTVVCAFHDGTAQDIIAGLTLTVMDNN